MVTLIEPVSVKDIMRAIIFYWKTNKEIPRYVRIIAKDYREVKYDLKKIMQQIKTDKGKQNNGVKVVADIWRTNNFYAWKYKKQRILSQQHS